MNIREQSQEIILIYSCGRNNHVLSYIACGRNIKIQNLFNKGLFCHQFLNFLLFTIHCRFYNNLFKEYYSMCVLFFSQNSCRFLLRNGKLKWKPVLKEFRSWKIITE
jgi:hypothetical protein